MRRVARVKGTLKTGPVVEAPLDYQHDRGVTDICNQ